MAQRSAFFAAMILLALSAAPSAAQPDRSLVPVCNSKFALCGYAVRGIWMPLIPHRYERAMSFSEGLAAVRLDGRFGYIDRSGTMVIAPRFDLAGEFSQGLAEVIVGNKAGVIDRAGNMVVPPIFRRAVPFTRDVVLATEGTWDPNATEGHESLPNLHGGATGLHEFGLYHVSGRWVRRGLRGVAQFGNGLIWTAEGELLGLLDSTGRWVVTPQYTYGGALHNGLALVSKRVGMEVLTGAIGPAGEVILPLQPRSLLSTTHFDWLRVREREGSERGGFVDRSGKLIGGRYFDKIDFMDQGDIPPVLVDGRWRGLDRDGNLVGDPRNGRVFASCPFGIRIVFQDGNSLVTGPDGAPTTPYVFDRIVLNPTCDKPFPVSLNGKWSFIGVDGKLLHDPPPFERVHFFLGEHAMVQFGGKWGFVDRSGRFTVEPRYEGYPRAIEGLFQVTEAGRSVWVNGRGEEQPAPQPKYTPDPERLSCYPELRRISRDGLWGIAEDPSGAEVIPPRFRAMSCFGNGITFVPDDTRRQWCPMGPDGRFRDKPACKTEYYPYWQSHSVPEQFADDRYENSVLWLRNYLEFHAGRRDVPPGWSGDGMRGGSPDVITRQ